MDEDDNIVRLAELQAAAGTLSEDSLALQFATLHADDLRYVATWSRWLAYDGTHWGVDSTLHAFDRARAICHETAQACDKARTVLSLESAKTVAAVVALARSDRRLAATVEQWDACPWLLQADDKTIDLRTGIAREPAPSDYITKKTSCCGAPRNIASPVDGLP